MTKGTCHKSHSTYKEHLLYSTQEGTYVHSAALSIFLLLISIDVGPFYAWLTLYMKLISLLYIIIYNLSFEINIYMISFIISLNIFLAIL